MEIRSNEIQEDKYSRAKKRVDEIRGFYIHTSVYTIINLFISINIYLNTDNFWFWGHFVTPFFWGIGLLFHGAKVFGFNPLFSKKWEERQIQKYIEQDRKNLERF